MVKRSFILKLLSIKILKIFEEIKIFKAIQFPMNPCMQAIHHWKRTKIIPLVCSLLSVVSLLHNSVCRVERAFALNTRCCSYSSSMHMVYAEDTDCAVVPCAFYCLCLVREQQQQQQQQRRRRRHQQHECWYAFVSRVCGDDVTEKALCQQIGWTQFSRYCAFWSS